MKEQKIQELLNSLFKLKFIKTYGHTSDSYKQLVIDEQAQNMVADLIRNHLKGINDERLGILEAKVFMYEQIIAKSTFAPMLEEKPVIDKAVEK